MSCSHVLFLDFDGVVVDTMSLKGDCLVRAFDGVSPGHDDEIRAFHHLHGGMNRRVKVEEINRLVFGSKLSTLQIDMVMFRFAENLKATFPRTTTTTGCLQYLRRWYQVFPIVIASAAPKVEVLDILKNLGMTHYFRDVMGYPPAKSEAIRTWLTLHAHSATKALLVGDSAEDMYAAARVGIPFVLFSAKNALERAAVQMSEFPQITDLRDLESIWPDQLFLPSKTNSVNL